MRLLSALAAAAVAATLATASGTAEQPSPSRRSPPVLGISYPASRDGILAWFDPRTLRALRGRKVNLAGHDASWAFSPDRAVLAAGNCEDHDAPSIRFVDARAVRVLGDVRLLSPDTCARELTWLRPRRLLSVVDDSTVVVVDPVARRVLRRIAVTTGGTVLSAVVRTNDELLLLLAELDAIGPARLAVVDPDGDVRTVTVEWTPVGSVLGQRTVSPGLAVDPEGRRAFLVSSLRPVRWRRPTCGRSASRTTTSTAPRSFSASSAG